jgi:uncharacterized protein YbaR (Trm112 family)
MENEKNSFPLWILGKAGGRKSSSQHLTELSHNAWRRTFRRLFFQSQTEFVFSIRFLSPHHVCVPRQNSELILFQGQTHVIRTLGSMISPLISHRFDLSAHPRAPYHSRMGEFSTLTILRCPLSNQPLRVATPEELSTLGPAAPEAALVREDGRVYYPVRNGIPLLLPGEQIKAPSP